MKRLLTGNQAIAQGAYEAGVGVAAAYPGTPSTEILESLGQFPDIYLEWSPNEKVALEVATGASYGGVRAAAIMKHVGLNVAADPFFAVAYTGVRGGLVVICADDPGIHSSQNEQDNRHYARFAKVPMLEPSDSQEAYILVQEAFDLSEQFDTPVLLRSTTRISHASTVVDVVGAKPERRQPGPFRRDQAKLVMIPAYAKLRHPIVEQRMLALAEFAETYRYNKIIEGSSHLGIISSGVAYQYAREAFPDASFLKLTLSYPLPERLIRQFAASVERLLVVEELDPFIEEQVLALGLKIEGKRFFSRVGELSLEAVQRGGIEAGLLSPMPTDNGSPAPAVALPLRPPALCAGCPHASTFYLLKKLGFYQRLAPKEGSLEERLTGGLKRSGLIVTGDIGCYTLGVLPPLLSIETCGCMGAGIGHAMGLERAGVPNKVVAVIGDSTFMHSGITGLLDAVYNQSSLTLIILDNETTAMTGHQGHPGSGLDPRGEKKTKVDIEKLVRGLGVEAVCTVDAYDLSAIESALRESVELTEPSVVIVRGGCALANRQQGGAIPVVDVELCDGCGTCFRLSCPALALQDGKAYVQRAVCRGDQCHMCLQICPQRGIVVEEELARV